MQDWKGYKTYGPLARILYGEWKEKKRLAIRKFALLKNNWLTGSRN